MQSYGNLPNLQIFQAAFSFFNNPSTKTIPHSHEAVFQNEWFTLMVSLCVRNQKKIN